MAILKFYRGLEASYVSSTHADGIYFCTDSGKIMLNGKQYGGADTGKTVKDAALEGTTLTITYTDNKTKKIELGDLVKYTSAIKDKNLAMPNTVGGLEKGTKVSQLENKTYSAMFDDLLFPTVVPTYEPPTASLSLKGYAAIVEAGVAGPNLVSNFTPGYDAGKIELNGVKQADRGGAQDLAKSFIFVDGVESNKTTPAKMKLGNTTFTYKASYGTGPQPKDNKGNNVGSPLAAGEVNSSAVTVNGTYPWYATTTDGTLKKQTLVKWEESNGTMETPEFTVVAHNGTTIKQSFKVPRKASQLQMWNTVSGKWEIIGGFPSQGGWTETHKNEDVNGAQVDYYTYTYSGAARAAAILKVKF